MKHVYFVGIGGIGMSGLAILLLERGVHVSGSDVSLGYTAVALQKRGAHIVQGHDAQHVPKDISCMVISTEIAADNPEVMVARQRGVPVLHRSELLAQLMDGYQALLVTGTHGKTTTSSLLTWMLYHAELEPSFAVGGIMTNLSTNAGASSGPYFVAEADESDGSFLRYPYYGAIVTNIDSDHLAHYGSMDSLQAAFHQFIKASTDPRFLVFCGDDTRLRELAPQGISYGFAPTNDLVVQNVRIDAQGTTFDIVYQGRRWHDIHIQLLGQHNALNASAVIGMAISLGIDEHTIREACTSFQGVQRRLEPKDAGAHYCVRDDYAHHPTEIAATVKALRAAIGPRRLVVVFQPHRPSRMKHIVHELSGAFDGADSVIVTDMYLSSENQSAEINNQMIIQAVQSGYQGTCHFCARDALVATVTTMARVHDVLLFLGAGDSTKAAADVASVLKWKEAQRWKVACMSDQHMTPPVETIDRQLYEVMVVSPEQFDSVCHEVDIGICQHMDMDRSLPVPLVRYSHGDDMNDVLRLHCRKIGPRKLYGR